ncbi:hypothetical protein TRAPUB_1983 [Trametes pubescens]|uniref:Uncharacterized protein n=1 Tax=Trametes pubescens TaxID=154538 RepID=A0A1M2VHW2_TRAPU|nr:hypothetical protein TRAPUB_1983 [Trametes pubescens]
MVVLTSHFTLLATLSSIAAISLLPTPADAAAIQVRYQDEPGQPISARHSASHGDSGKKSDGRKHSDSSTSDLKTSSSKMVASTKNAADAPQRHPKPVIPLPARLAQKSAQETSKKKAGGSDGGHSRAKESKHSASKRAVWDPIDPVSRMERFWMGGQDGIPAHLNKRHHHHHDDDRHDHEKVIVDGDDDHVNVHHRSITQDRVARAPHDDHDRVLVEGHNDRVHVHDDADHDHDRVVINGDDDHVHVHRSPSPHHHADHHDEVVVKGDHDSVHFHRSPEPAPHHHHHNDHHDHDAVIVKGDNDHVKVHRRSPSPHHRHHHTVVVKGDNQHVHVGRSPAPVPQPHSHHRHHDKVVVKGDHDHVNVHSRGYRGYYSSQPIVIPGNRGEKYHVHQASYQKVSQDSIRLSPKLRRDGGSSNGVPGSIEIMSTVAGSDADQRIASLVLAAQGNGTTGDNSTFVLNASDTNSTQLYLIPTPDSNADALSADPASSPPATFIKVALQMGMFDPPTAQLRSYCATFDPHPEVPAPMTMEPCTDGSSADEHKSQVFAYTPSTGVIQPMWFQGQGAAAEGDDSDDSTVPTDDPSDGDRSDDDQGGTSNSTTVDPTTPTSSKVVNVTSLQQEALDEQYGDATRPPTRMASVKTLAADTPSGARNVTMLFSPASPEILPAAPPAQDKVAVPASSTDLVTSSAASVSGTATSTATSDTSTTITTTSSATASVAMETSTSSDTSSGAASTTSSLASSSASSTVTESTTSASATASSAFEVKVYNPYAEDSDSINSSATTSFSSTSTPTASATMTPVSTAPYEWMFKQGSLPDLD